MTWIEPISFTPSITPGQALQSAACLHDLHAGDGGADAKPAVFGRDLPHLWDFLDVDQELRLDQVGFHLNDDIGATGQHAGGPGRSPPAARQPPAAFPGLRT